LQKIHPKNTIFTREAIYGQIGCYSYYIAYSSMLLMVLGIFVFQSVIFLGIVEKHFVYASIRPPPPSPPPSPPPPLSPPANASNFNFVSVGDWGCKPATKATIDNIQDRNPELILGLGDYSYESTADCWLKLTEQFGSKLKIAIGNHETRYDPPGPSPPAPASNYSNKLMLKQYMDHFNLTKQYYSFNYQNAHFLVMSTEDELGVDSKQYDFIQRDLATASSDPDIEWIMVYVHKVFYHSCEFYSETCVINRKLRETYHPLFEAYGVDLVLYGHYHSYERTYPLRYNTINESSPIITDLNLNNYNSPKGPLFVTIGTGGHSLYELEKRPYFVVAQYDKGYGILDVNIEQNNRTLDAKFYSNEGRSDIDQFRITRCGNDFASEPNFSTSTSNISNGDTNVVKKNNNFCENIDATTVVNNNNMTDLRPAGPYLTLNGSNFAEIASNSSLQLTKFSVAAWFRASNISTPEDTESNKVIITKTGTGKDTRGDNLNYGIWLAPSGRLRAGFEGLNGTDHYLQSTHLYNDSKWHFVALAYDGSALRLHIDGVQIDNVLTHDTIVPDNTDTRPLRIGANAYSDKEFFVGNIDEVRIWNRPLTNAEIGEGYTRGIFNATGQVLYLPFG
jgi:hypothetical protein